MGEITLSPIPSIPRGSSRIVDLRDGWFRYLTVAQGAAFGGVTASKQIANLLSGVTEASYFNVTNQSTIQVHNGLVCLTLPNSAVNAASGYERIIANPIFPPPALVAPGTGALRARGPLVFRQWWTIAFSGAADPGNDVGVTIQAGMLGSNATLTSSFAQDGASGFGVLMVGDEMRFRAKKWATPLPGWIVDDVLPWPGALTDWVTVEFRIHESEGAKKPTLDVLLNNVIVESHEFGGALEAIPVDGQVSALNLLGKCRNRDTGPANMYVREYGLIVGPDEAGTY